MNSEIDSSDDEADLALWKQRVDQKHRETATATNVENEGDARDKNDHQVVHSSRDKQNDCSNEDMDLDMNVKPSKRKRKRGHSSFQNGGVASAKATLENKFPNGMKVAKMTWIPFEGKITYTPKNKSEWYHVVYDDGDEEDMAQFDVEFCVNAYYKKYPKESRPISKKSKKNFAVNTKMIRQFPEFTTGKVVSSKIDENSNNRIWYVSFEGDTGNEIPVTEDKMKELALNYEAMLKKLNDEKGDAVEKRHALHPTGEESTSISKDMDDEKSSDSCVVHDQQSRVDEKLDESPTKKSSDDKQSRVDEKLDVSQECSDEMKREKEAVYPLVLPEDKNLIHDYLYLALEQMEPCKGSNGTRGYECKWCVGRSYYGKYFPASEAALLQPKYFNYVLNHVRKCKSCPAEIRQNLDVMIYSKTGQEPILDGRVFVHRLWCRIQSPTKKSSESCVVHDKQSREDETLDESPTRKESTPISKDLRDNKSTEYFNRDVMVEKYQDESDAVDEKVDDSIVRDSSIATESATASKDSKGSSEFIKHDVMIRKVQNGKAAVGNKVDDSNEGNSPNTCKENRNTHKDSKQILLSISLTEEGTQNEKSSTEKELSVHLQSNGAPIRHTSHIRNSLASNMNRIGKAIPSKAANSVPLPQKQQSRQKSMNSTTFPTVHMTSNTRKGQHQPNFVGTNIMKSTVKCSYPPCQIVKGLLKCGGCNYASYCSTNCQSFHWSIHQKTCGKGNNVSTQQLHPSQTQIPTQQQNSLQNSHPQHHQQYRQPYQQPIHPYQHCDMQQQQHFVSNAPLHTPYQHHHQQQHRRPSIPLNNNDSIQLSDNHTRSAQRIPRTNFNNEVNSSHATSSKKNLSKTKSNTKKAPNPGHASNQTPLKRKAATESESTKKKYRLEINETSSPVDNHKTANQTSCDILSIKMPTFSDIDLTKYGNYFSYIDDFILKDFVDEETNESSTFRGQIKYIYMGQASVNSKEKELLFHVQYSDGDTEDLTLDEVHEFRNNYKKRGDCTQNNDSVGNEMIENDDSKDIEVDEDLFHSIKTVTKVALTKRKSLSKVNKENDNTSYELDTNNKHETMSDEQDTGDEEKDSSTTEALSSGEKPTTSRDRDDEKSPEICSAIEVGTKIAKTFMVAYRGEITSVPSIDNEYYHVVYDDGDEEDLDFNEVEACVEEYLKHHPRSPERKKLKRKRGEKFPIGTRILKEFSETFRGEITKVCRNRPRFYIQYEDSNFEVLTSRNEIQQLILNYENLEEDENS